MLFMHSLTRGFRSFILDQELFDPDDPVLLAVSGGLDSVVMMRLFSECGFRFGIAHCNFQLRGSESEEDENFVRNLASGSGVPFFHRAFETEKLAREQGISIQMAARDLRYKWFEEIRQQNHYQYIATAHHLDDQAETILINLIRGTGIAGLHGILPKTGRLVRPLMFATREHIESYAAQNAILFRNDSSNDDVKYRRNRIRHQLLPEIKALNPGFPEKLQGTINRIRETENAAGAHIEQWKRENLSIRPDKVMFSTAMLLETGFPSLLLYSVASPFGFTESQLQNVLEGLSDTRTKRFFSGSHQLIKNRRSIVISRRVPDPSDKDIFIGDFNDVLEISEPLQIKFRKVVRSDDMGISADPLRASLDLDRIAFPLIIRKWRRGDDFRPLGLNGRKKISDFFADQKFSEEEKNNCWLLCCGSDIIWVIGHRIDHHYRVTADTSRILDIFFG